MLNGQAGYFTFAEAAALLHVSPRAIANYVRKNRVPTNRVGNSPVVRLQDLWGLRVPYVALR
jgi:hypothetical protein